LKDWLANTPIRGQHSFDYFENRGSDECIEVVRDIISQGEGMFNANTTFRCVF
jgi:hypothetical protein